MMRRLSRWAVLSLALHPAAWLALLLGPGLVGRILPRAPEPATIDVVLGEGGITERPTRDDDASAAPEAPTAPPPDIQPEPPPPPLPPERPDKAAPPLPEPPLPNPPPLPSPPPPSSGGPAAVRLGDAGRPPHADLLDPENNRFRAATQDNGNRMPSYPIDAARRLESGAVKLQLFIDPTGQVVNALVTRSSGSASLDRVARDQALTWRFTPARRDGKSVADIVDIEIDFRLM